MRGNRPGLKDLLCAVSADLTAEELLLDSLKGIIGAEIAMHRRKKNMSQKEFASSMGVSQALVSRWEQGETNYTLETLVKIAAALDIPMQCPFDTEKPRVYSYTTVGNITQFPGQWVSSSYQAQDEYEALAEM